MKTVEEINQDEVLVNGDKFVRATLNPYDIKDLFPNNEERKEMVNLYPGGESYVYAGIFQTISFIKTKLGYKQ